MDPSLIHVRLCPGNVNPSLIHVALCPGNVNPSLIRVGMCPPNVNPPLIYVGLCLANVDLRQSSAPPARRNSCIVDARAYAKRHLSMKSFLSLLVAFASAGSALAQAPGPEPVLPRTTNLLEAMVAAGPVMLLLFLLSIFSVMLIIVFFFTIRRGAIVSSGYMATADALLRKRDYLGLLAVSNRHGEAVARVVQKTLDFMTKNPNADFAQAREIAQTEGTRVATNLHNRVTYLADIATIGPLVGLFGTVIGIIRAFGALGSELGPTRYILLSKGISEALINTCGGLGIGITAMIFYAFFRGRAQRLVSDLESASTHILALLSTQPNRRRERAPALLEDEF